jgi:hypothetical protein
MNKRDRYIQNWVHKHRPDLSFEEHIEPGIRNHAIGCLMAIAFEAGREFQQDNPEAAFTPNVYLST